MTGLRVLKLGGSLLDFDGLSRVLDRWLDEQRPLHNVIISGGGALADAVRRFDVTHQLGDETAHWLAVQTMSVTARLAARVLAAVLVTELCDVQTALENARCVVLDVHRFLENDEPHCGGAPLPRCWDVTSDSIAARVAEVLGAEELVLLKSTLPDGGDWRSLADRQYVDRHFPQAAAALPTIRCVDLRHPQTRQWCPSRAIG